MLFPLWLSREEVTLGSENLFGSNVLSCLLCVADAVADSADEWRRARSPINATFSSVFQPAAGFTLTSCVLHHAPTTSGTSSPSTSHD